jgi:hypothetical protein
MASPAATPLVSPGIAFAAAAVWPPTGGAPPAAAHGPQLRQVVHAEQAAVDEGKEVGAVVLTVKRALTDKSFDELFKRIPQQGAAGTRVAVYECNYASLAQIMVHVANPPAGPNPTTVYEQLGEDISRVAAQSVVLNFECCSGCSERGFEGAGDEIAGLWFAIKSFMDRGSFVMASDFSLKAIIADWKPDILGPNPFVRLPVCCNGSFDLSFDPNVLAECPSAQLVTVGKLATGGHARSHAMASTIIYAVDEAQATAAASEGSIIQVLTVASKIDGTPADQHLRRSSGGGSPKLSQAEGDVAATGLAGHILLTRPSGGMLLTSMGHWIEMVKLDVSEESLLSTAQDFSPEFQSQMEGELSAARTPMERTETVQRYSSKMVSMSSPCSPAVRRKR